MTVAYLPGGDEVRVAYAIGRQVGPAVVRNRLRRRLRAAVREIDRSTGGLPTGAYLVSAAARGGAAHATASCATTSAAAPWPPPLARRLSGCGAGR